MMALTQRCPHCSGELALRPVIRLEFSLPKTLQHLSAPTIMTNCEKSTRIVVPGPDPPAAGGGGVWLAHVRRASRACSGGACCRHTDCDCPRGSAHCSSHSIGAGSPPAPPTIVQGVSPLATAAPLVARPARYTYRVLDVLPHDPNAFTQGLIYTDSIFYEGTGRNGSSSLRKVEPSTGQVLQQHDLGEEFFGEGITLFDDKIYQLSWQNRTGFIYDQETFTELRRFNYPTEGWGITHDGEQLIVSDGTPFIYFWDPLTLAETGRITVTLEGQLLPQLNELEYINGEIWANIWQTDYVVRIDPTSGVVTGVVDFSGLLNYAPPLRHLSTCSMASPMTRRAAGSLSLANCGQPSFCWKLFLLRRKAPGNRSSGNHGACCVVRAACDA